MDALDVGTEMVIDPAAWQTRGKKWQDVRTAINKAKRDGITDVLATFKESPFSVQTQIREISTQWAGEKALPEMGFTLGGVDELVDPRVKLLYAVDTDGRCWASPAGCRPMRTAKWSDGRSTSCVTVPTASTASWNSSSPAWPNGCATKAKCDS